MTHVRATMPAARALLGITGPDLYGDAGEDIAASFRAFPIGAQGARGTQQEKAQFLTEWHEFLVPFDEELRFFLLSSACALHPYGERPEGCSDILPGIAIQARPSDAQKCARCWHRRPDLGHHPEHPDICDRCVENLTLPGETREFC